MIRLLTLDALQCRLQSIDKLNPHMTSLIIDERVMSYIIHNIYISIYKFGLSVCLSVCLGVYLFVSNKRQNG